MATASDLRALAKRVCEEQPSRELDFAISKAANPDFHGWHRWALREAALYRDGWREGCGRKVLGPILLRDRKREAVSLYLRYAEDSTPHYTTSLDVAVSLMPKGWIRRNSHIRGGWLVETWRGDVSFNSPVGAGAIAETEAAALCAAALLARAADMEARDA